MFFRRVSAEIFVRGRKKARFPAGLRGNRRDVGVKRMRMPNPGISV
jgi:hypothetical protein